MSTRFEFTNRARPILEVGLGSSTIDESAALWDVSLWDAVGSQWNGDEPLWRDVACDTIEAHIEIGRGRVADAFPVGTADIVVDNDSGWADPSVEPDEGTPGWIEFDGGAGWLSVPDSAALDLTGDMTVIVRIMVLSTPVGNRAPILCKGNLTGDLAYLVDVEPDTDTRFVVSPTGSATVGIYAATTNLLPRMLGEWRWVAFAYDRDNGSGDHHISVWYGGAGAYAEPWQIIESTTAPGTLATATNTLPLLIGGELFSSEPFNGRIGYVEIRNGHGGYSGANAVPGGSTVFKLNGWNLTEGDVGASTITADTGQTITVIQDGTSVPRVSAAITPFNGLLKMRPGRAIRIGVNHATLGDKWLFRGFVDSIEPVDDPEDWSTVRLRCIDALGEAGRAKLSSETETGEDEESRTRFSRILNLIRWPGTKRSINASAIRPLYAAEMTGQVIDLLRQTAESEGGWAYADNNGNIVLQNRDWLYHETTETVDAVIGNIGEDDVCPGRWVRTFDRADIATQVIFGNDYPTTEVSPLEPVVVNDFPSQNLYGLEVYERLDLWTKNRTTLIQNAGRVLGTRSAGQSMPLIRSVTLDAGMSDDVLDVMAAMSIYTPSRYRCRLQKNGRVVFNGIFFAVGATHDLSASAWTANVSLDRAGSYAVLDPVDYVWDTGRWDHSLWN